MANDKRRIMQLAMTQCVGLVIRIDNGNVRSILIVQTIRPFRFFFLPSFPDTRVLEIMFAGGMVEVMR